MDPKPFALCPWHIMSYPNTKSEKKGTNIFSGVPFLVNGCADDDDGDLCRPRVEPNSGTL